MLNDRRAFPSSTAVDDQVQEHGDRVHTTDEEHVLIRDIHALTTPTRPPSRNLPNNRSLALSTSTPSNDTSSAENFTTMSREFSALVLAGSAIESTGNTNYQNDGVNNNGNRNLLGIGEEEETNPLAIVADNNNNNIINPSNSNNIGRSDILSVQGVKKEESESKINAWQTAKTAKINNRFKREDAVISGWENEQIQKSSSWMKKIERKLEEKRARALEKMENNIAKARRKAEERRASAEAKRGTKVAQIMEIANLMRAVGRPPVKRSFF